MSIYLEPRKSTGLDCQDISGETSRESLNQYGDQLVRTFECNYFEEWLRGRDKYGQEKARGKA